MGADLRNNGQFIATGDPATVNEDIAGWPYTPFQFGQLGHVTAITRTAYPNLPKLVQYIARSPLDDLTAALGKVAYWKDYDDFIVTMKRSDSFDALGVNHVAGIFLGAYPAALHTGYIAVGGIADVYIKATPSTSPTAGGLPVHAEPTIDGEADVAAEWDSTTIAQTCEVIAKTIEAGVGGSATECVLLIDRVGW